MNVKQCIDKKLNRKNVPYDYVDDIEQLRSELASFDNSTDSMSNYELYVVWLEFSESMCAGFLSINEDMLSCFFDWIGYDVE